MPTFASFPSMKHTTWFFSVVLVALLLGGCGGNEEIDEKPNAPEAPESSQEIKQEPTQAAQETAMEEPKKETGNKAALREIPQSELEQRVPGNGLWHVKGEEDPFTGLGVGYHKDGSKSVELPYVKGLGHGTAIYYNMDGSKKSEHYWENGVFKGQKSF
tara:strand:+ start:558 stop:1034 length:477 start_codon:yes stop_codon:yes gene_type:complete